jgi:glycosyltransferase involved in cell wall biosynthesis
MTRGPTTRDGYPIRPVFSHDIFIRQRFGGVSRYFAELHRALRRLGVPSTILAPLHRCELLDRGPGVVGVRIPRRLQLKKTGMVTVGAASEPAALALLASMYKQVVLHRTYYSDVRPTLRTATAVTVYDMIHERHRDAFFTSGDPTTSQKRLWCERTDVIFAISHHTKAELVDVFGIAPDRIVVTHLGVTKVEPDQATVAALHESSPFLLYVGSRAMYKNFDHLIKAFARSTAPRSGVRIVAFGGGPSTPMERRHLDVCGISNLVTFTDGDDARLAAYYAGAIALVYPSLDEGFGLPPLEAMLHGCPVGASLGGAIPEIVADAALLFDPTSEEEIAGAIDSLLSDSDCRSRLVKNGCERVAKFTWDATARATLEGYQAALSHAEARPSSR